MRRSIEHRSLNGIHQYEKYFCQNEKPYFLDKSKFYKLKHINKTLPFATLA